MKKILVLITILSSALMLNSCVTDEPPQLPAHLYYNQSIMGYGQATASQMARLLLIKNPALKRKAWDIAVIYQQEGNSEGVNADVAFTQMCLETNYLRYGGQVDAKQNNFCGLGALDGGAKGHTFATVRLGVRAHIQHLKAYASKSPLRNKCVDPRFKYVKRGISPTIKNLTRRWASDPRYHYKISSLLARLHTLPAS